MRLGALAGLLALAVVSLASVSRLEHLPLILRRPPKKLALPQSTYALPSFTYGRSTVRGVNLGGWLVLEPYMTPSLFRGVPHARDEWTLCESLGRSAATTLLSRHWRNFVAESDFRLMAEYGLNHVRLPIGYWAYDISNGEPYVQGQLPYLQQAVLWAAKYGLRVMIDLHGAPGSQNGFDNSGHSGAMAWHKAQVNLNRTKAVISELVAEFRDPRYSNAVTMIEMLNEPAGFKDPSIVPVYQRFLQSSYRLIRYPDLDAPKNASQIMVAYHDAFLGLKAWATWWPRLQYPMTVIDTHPYTVFSPSMTAWDMSQRTAWVCRQRGNYAASKKLRPTIAGEWSPAVTDCAGALNGIDAGARYDGTFPGSAYVGSCVGKTGDAAHFDAAYVEQLRRYWEAQTRVYGGAGDGWMMWNWKTEAGYAEDWSYVKGVKYGWIPRDAVSYRYPDPCRR